jgi:ankyrin repeat protein
MVNQPHIASIVHKGEERFVEFLLNAGVDPNNPAGNGETALDVAVFDDRADLAALLIAHNARVDLTWGGSTALDFAAAGGRVEIARLLINHGADVRRVYPSGRTALHMAVRNHNRDMAELLIDRGADVNAHTAYAAPPLSEAVHRDFQDMTALLLNAGADPYLSNGTLSSPMDLAIHLHRTAIVRQITAFAPKPDPSLISQAALSEFGDIVEVLLNAGVDGSPCLHDLALKGKATMLRLLLDKGANANHRSRTGATPLHDAALAGNTAAIDVLLAHHADINARETDSGDTPLYMAAAFGREDAARLLLEKGADPNIPDKNGATPLHATLATGDSKIAEAIRTHGGR